MNLGFHDKKDYCHKAIGWGWNTQGLPHDVRESYAEFRKSPGHSPPYQSDHLEMADGGPIPTGMLFAGWLQACSRSVNQKRTSARLKNKALRIRRKSRCWRNYVRR